MKVIGERGGIPLWELSDGSEFNGSEVEARGAEDAILAGRGFAVAAGRSEEELIAEAVAFLSERGFAVELPKVEPAETTPATTPDTPPAQDPPKDEAPPAKPAKGGKSA